MIGREEILDNIESYQNNKITKVIKNKQERIVFSKAISLYLKYMFEALLNGHSWRIHRFGIFKIISKKIDGEKLRFTPKFYKDNEIRRNTRVMNPKTIGLVFSLSLESEFLKNDKCRFKSASWFRRAMNKKLLETGKITV